MNLFRDTASGTSDTFHGRVAYNDVPGWKVGRNLHAKHGGAGPAPERGRCSDERGVLVVPEAVLFSGWA